LKTHQKFLTHAALICCTWPVAALAGDYGTVYTQIGTNGLGIGYAASLSPDWALRGQFNSFKQSFSGNVGDFGAGSALTIDLNLNSVPLLADWYPSDGGFRLTGGLVFNNNKISIAGTGIVGTNTLSSVINAEIKLSDSASPYLGIGYATRPKDAKGLGFNFDLGAMMQNPSVSLTATGGFVTATQIEEQRVKILDAVNNLKVMPVFGLGINYAF
jgi:hypothetical protein